MSQAMRIFASLLCIWLCCCTLCIAFVFEDCGSTLGRFTEVSVSNCPISEEKCTLLRGNNASISIRFIPNKDISQVKACVYGVMLDISVPFPLDKPDVCKDPACGIQCPLHKDQEYYYTTTMFVQKSFPAVSVGIKWEFVDDKKNKIICVLFPAKLK